MKRWLIAFLAILCAIVGVLPMILLIFVSVNSFLDGHIVAGTLLSLVWLAYYALLMIL